MHNVTVSFDRSPEPEYDLLFALGSNNILNAEVENHSGTESQPGENYLMDNPLSEADYINANKVFSVVNGIDADKLGQYRNSAELRNVDILEKNDCLKTISDYIQTTMMPTALNTSHHQQYHSQIYH